MLLPSNLSCPPPDLITVELCKPAKPNRHQLWNIPVRMIISIAILEVACFGLAWWQGLTTGPEKFPFAELEMTTSNFSKIIGKESTINNMDLFKGKNQQYGFFFLPFFGYRFRASPNKLKSYNRKITCFRTLSKLWLQTKKNSMFCAASIQKILNRRLKGEVQDNISIPLK